MATSRGKAKDTIAVTGLHGQEVIVSKTELESWLGLSATGVSGLIKRGVIERQGVSDMNGQTHEYNLFLAVRRYIDYLKEEMGKAKTPAEDRQALELEHLRWKVEGSKSKVLAWREQRDKAVAGELVASLSDAMGTLRRELKGDMKAMDAIDRFVARLASTDVDAVHRGVEGLEEEDDGED